jgi:hypothetical protein
LIVSGKKKEKKLKSLWSGVFNGQRQVYYITRYAFSAKQARIVMCQEIARRSGVDDWMVLKYFQEGGENYKIKLEVEFKEDDEEGNRDIETQDFIKKTTGHLD